MMKPDERLINLTTEERAQLEASKIEDYRGCVWLLGFLFLIIFLGVLGALYYAWLDRSGTVITGGLLGLLLIFVVLSVVAMRYAAKAWGKPTENNDVARDLLGGVKKVVTEKITAKNIGGKEVEVPGFSTNLGSRGTALKAISEVEEVEILYLITFGGKQYEIPSELYYRLNIGDEIEIHMAPNSARIFSYWVKATNEILSEIKVYEEK